MSEVPIEVDAFVPRTQTVNLTRVRQLTNPHAKTKSMVFRPLMYLGSHSFLGGLSR